MAQHAGGSGRRWEQGWPDQDEFAYEEDIPEGERDWRRPRGIFVLAPIGGEAGDRIWELQKRYDPKLAASSRPHVTLVGSSGAGPIVPGTSLERLQEALAPVAAGAEPLVLRFGAPTRFMQTNIISLPLDPNGPARALYERIRGSGLEFLAARFAFTPHATLHYYPTLGRTRARELLSVRVDEPAVIDRIELSLTNDPQPPKHLLTLPLGG